jgi:putative membrane protein
MTMTKAALPFVASIAAVMGLWLVQAAYAADTKLNDADQKFLKEAAEISMTEVQLGKLAQDHAATQPVMKFGQRMVRDHTRMANELRDLAKSKGVTLPDKLDKKHQKMVDQMSSLRAGDFDRAYTKDMVSGHEEAIQKFEDEARNGHDPEIKAWAAKEVKILQDHLRFAQKTVKAVQGGR